VDVHPLETRHEPPGLLAGVAVLVTRPVRQAADLVRRLSALGAAPIAWPAIVILPPADTAALARVQATLDRYDLAIFVSANAVEYGVGDPLRWPASLTAFAPGPGTAEAMAAVGIANARIPATTFDSEGLLALPELDHVGGKRVIVFRGDGGRETLGDTLRARGATVDYVACYRRAAPSPSAAASLVATLRERRLHAITLTSSEGLDNLLDALGSDARALLTDVPLFVPHPRIAAHARDRGWAAIATPGSDAGLIGGLLEWFAAHPLTKAT
jgi:uroporphyrinogen-III synthase